MICMYGKCFGEATNRVEMYFGGTAQPSALKPEITFDKGSHVVSIPVCAAHGSMANGFFSAAAIAMGGDIHLRYGAAAER